MNYESFNDLLNKNYIEAYTKKHILDLKTI